MQLKALRPLTAFTSPTVSHKPVQARATRSFAHAVRPPPPPDDEGEAPVPPPISRPPRSGGTAAPLPPPPKHHRRRRPNPKPKPNLANPTGSVLKILGGLTALVGAWHAAPAVHEHLHKHHRRRPDEVIREDIVIELPETGPVHPDMGHREI